MIRQSPWMPVDVVQLRRALLNAIVVEVPGIGDRVGHCGEPKCDRSGSAFDSVPARGKRRLGEFSCPARKQARPRLDAVCLFRLRLLLHSCFPALVLCAGTARTWGDAVPECGLASLPCCGGA